MKKYKKILVTLSLILLVFVFTNTISAQSNTPPDLDVLPENINQGEYVDTGVKTEAFKLGEPAACFDYYTPNKVNINIDQDYIVYNAGDPVLMSGFVKNSNTYPVIGLDIKARLVRSINSPNEKDKKEIITIDEFNIAENITLPVDKEYKVSYSHILPLNYPSGQYQIFFYAIEQDRFNLAGLSYTNNVVGSKIVFDVKGTDLDHVYLDQNNIKIGDQALSTNGATISELKNIKNIPIYINIYNPEKQARDMTITYDLYSWDSANPKNKITTKTEQVTILPNSKKTLTYILDEGVLPVYYLSVTSKPTNQTKKDSIFKEKTISNIRFVIQDKSKTRLFFSGVDTYPLIKGNQVTLVTCFNDMGENVNDINKNISEIETVILDDKGKEIAKTLYKGKVYSEIDAIIQKFNPKKNISNFTVVSTIYDSEKNIIDKVEKKYNCQEIDPNKCVSEKTLTDLLPLILIIIFIVFVLWLLLIFIKKIINNTKK